MLIIPDYLVKELFDRLMKDREHELFEGEYDAIIGGIRDASSDSEKFEKLFLDLIPLLARYFFNRSGGAWSLSDFPIVPELREEFKKDTITVPVGITDGDLKRIQEEFVDSLSWVALTHEGRGLPETNNHQDIEYDKLPKVLLNDAKVKRLYRNEDYFQVCLLLSLHEIGHLCHHWGNLIKNLTGPNDGTYDPINHIPFIAKSATEVQEEEAWEFCEVILGKFFKHNLINSMQHDEIVGCMEKEITRAAKFKAEIKKKYGQKPSEVAQTSGSTQRFDFSQPLAKPHQFGNYLAKLEQFLEDKQFLEYPVKLSQFDPNSIDEALQILQTEIDVAKKLGYEAGEPKFREFLNMARAAGGPLGSIFDSALTEQPPSL